MAAWLALGLTAGIGLGLFLGWVAWPAQFTDADPTVLDESYQQDYTVMIAAAYGQDGNLEAARRRLGQLGKADSNAWLLSVTVDYILARREETEIRQLVKLANDLGLRSPAMEPYLPADPQVGGG